MSGILKSKCYEENNIIVPHQSINQQKVFYLLLKGLSSDIFCGDDEELDTLGKQT